ncbi:MAG: hypothetical protein IPK50_16305 [Fibrobacterota bacterium]|nr:hypothetical protein [Fibrobacterota bacterium]QQS03844.1 MAG: hypothetical protein IPK50_16305 [Fibrobacterota bacterium]
MDLRNFFSRKWMLAINGIFLFAVLIIAALSFLFNFGWYRFMFAVVLIPYYFIYASFNIFYVLWLWVAPWRMIPLLWLGGLTFLAANLLLPDAGDSGELYACFRQLEIVGPEPDLFQLSRKFWIANLAIGALQFLQGTIDLILKFREPSPSASPN